MQPLHPLPSLLQLLAPYSQPATSLFARSDQRPSDSSPPVAPWVLWASPSSCLTSPCSDPAPCYAQPQQPGTPSREQSAASAAETLGRRPEQTQPSVATARMRSDHSVERLPCVCFPCLFAAPSHVLAVAGQDHHFQLTQPSVATAGMPSAHSVSSFRLVVSSTS